MTDPHDQPLEPSTEAQREMLAKMVPSLRDLVDWGLITEEQALAARRDKLAQLRERWATEEFPTRRKKWSWLQRLVGWCHPIETGGGTHE